MISPTHSLIHNAHVQLVIGSVNDIYLHGFNLPHLMPFFLMLMQLCDLLKPRVESPSFLEMLGSIHVPACHAMPGIDIASTIYFCHLYSSNINCCDACTDDSGGWDVVCEKDLWEGGAKGDEGSSDQEDYVLVRQEDIVEGIACFMAAYLLSLKHTKVCQSIVICYRRHIWTVSFTDSA